MKFIEEKNISMSSLNIVIDWIFNTKFVVCLFLLLNLVKISFSLFSQNEGIKLILVRGGALFVFTILTYLFFKRKYLATIILSLLIMVTGLLSTVIGFAFISLHQYLQKIVFIIIGVYFLFGGFKLFIEQRGIREGQ